jgi:hypothetical protein
MRWRLPIAGGVGEVRFLGNVAGSPALVERLTRKLAERYDKLHFCYESGPTVTGCTGTSGSWVTTARSWRHR